MRGDGRIFQRGAQWWIAYWSKTDHKEVREPAGTEKQAKKKLQARVAEVRTGTYTAPKQERVTVGELLDAYELDLKAREKKSKSTATHIKEMRRHFGLEKALAITSERLERFASGQRDDEKKPATINNELTVLRSAYRLAVKQRRLSSGAVPYFPLRTVKNARQGFFERHEFEAVAKFLPDYLADTARFAYLTGWRRGEIVGLGWDAVDRAAREVRLYDSKNGDGRVLALDGEVWELIDARWAAREVRFKDGTTYLSPLVFHKKGKPIGDIRKTWAKATKDAELTGKLFHDLRRSASRDMVRAGVPQSVAMSITGHKTVSTFLRYKITSGDEQREALRRTADMRSTQPATADESKVVAMSRKQ